MYAAWDVATLPTCANADGSALPAPIRVSDTLSQRVRRNEGPFKHALEERPKSRSGQPEPTRQKIRLIRLHVGDSRYSLQISRSQILGFRLHEVHNPLSVPGADNYHNLTAGADPGSGSQSAESQKGPPIDVLETKSLARSCGSFLRLVPHTRPLGKSKRGSDSIDRNPPAPFWVPFWCKTRQFPTFLARVDALAARVRISCSCCCWPLGRSLASYPALTSRTSSCGTRPILGRTPARCLGEQTPGANSPDPAL